MKIQIASDLHLELWHRDLPSPTHQFAPDRTRDLLILAGDIVNGKRKFGLPFIRRELGISPVIFVPGNHEYYHATKPDVDAFWRAFADANEGFHYLNDDTAEIQGLRFYGAEWCSDFWGDPMHHARYTMMISDFTLTKDWNTFKHAEEFRRVSENITAQAGKVDVVVTHFPPTLEAIDQELYNGDPFNPYFINDAKPLVQYVGAKLWVSGHTHSPFDYQAGATRVVGNPRGYKEEPPRPGFSVMKTVEV